MSLTRGRLEGVADTLVLRVSHLGGGPDANRLVEEVLQRCAKPESRLHIRR